MTIDIRYISYQMYSIMFHMDFLGKTEVNMDFLGKTENTSNWPLIPPLPSYGRGRERPGDRYMSFLHGDGLHDVNGTIDGQGDIWWNMWRQRTLQFTRPNLIEFLNSKNIIISNVIFRNFPFWNIHLVYCSHVVIRYVTIFAPADSPNTDGIDPISSETSGGVENVLLEHINLSNIGVGIHVKTNIGRGGFIRNITVYDVYMENSDKG
ncbi:hypothetical protein Dsin_007879 [Dipteronia sinensis]|uniref:Polygalacturonase n=1 Tax=Dipteronia sinensis TaxID=43782 RepID=A0AAE0B1D3_9ROSI|nr:hypothetical protein Dsin_007879 [Dipteronia sinensis]